jgi:fumarylacetoacetase
VWHEVRESLLAAWDTADERFTVPVAAVTLHLPWTFGDYVDFYASEHHAANLGRLFRPDSDPLTPNWKHLPIGYHGRSGTVVVSGTPVRRPRGQRRTPNGEIVFGPSTRLDMEVAFGFVVGAGSRLGDCVPQAAFADHVLGVCLVNDWSARDIQAWEYVPLGPFLGKSFATSVSRGWCRSRPWSRPASPRRRGTSRCRHTWTTGAAAGDSTSPSRCTSTVTPCPGRRWPRCTGPGPRCSPT